MRSEEEMLTLIKNTARDDERIRAVYMNGSRTNKNADKDIFQDYDIVYVVRDTKPFREDKAWIDRFGKRLYMQYPEDNIWYSSRSELCYGWLIQFEDGNRLDLHVCTIEFSQSEILNDKLCVVLLDKDGCLPEIGEATDIDYHVKRPTEQEFLCTANEFWWCLNNVAKGLWRDEVPYVHDMLDGVIRGELIKMLSWKVGIKTDFSCSVGKSGKYLKKYLNGSEYRRFLDTYAGGAVMDIWNAVFIMCELFDDIATEVSDALGFAYDKNEAKASLGYLKKVYDMPSKG